MRQRPLLALAVVAALFAAAIAALAPAGAQSGEGSQQSITWSIGLALKDANSDGIFEKGDTPELQVTFAAAITPDASDQAGDGITGAVITTDTPLAFAPTTSLTISGGQGIEFQLGPNSQIDRLRGGHINDGSEGPTFTCETPSAAAGKSNGSSPATASCAIDTGILISIPQTVPDNTYNIRGRVAFDAGSLSVDYMQDSGLTDATDDAADARADRTLASEAFTGTTDEGVRTRTGDTELNEGSASFPLVIGPVAAVDSVSLTPASKCTDSGSTSSVPVGLDDGVLTDRDGPGSTACKTTLRTIGGTHSHFELKILNSANRGVMSGQVIAVVGTLVRETGGNAVFESCAGVPVNSSSCTPTVATLNTTSSFFTVRAPSTPGTGTLRIQVVPRAGGTETREIPLIFTGPATSIELSDVPSTVLNRNVDAADANLTDEAKGTDSIVLTITPKDADGNVVTQTRTYNYELTGPDSRRVVLGSSTAGIAVKQGPTPSTSDDAGRSSPNQVLIDVTRPATNALMTGEYTLTVKRTARNLSATTTFRVVGPAGNLELSLGDTCTNGRGSLAEVGCTFEVTATVTDADGNNVADGTEVALSATNTDGSNAQNLILSGAGSDSTRTNLKTAAGKAVGTATVVGNGEVLLVATASGGAVSDSQIADTTASASAVGAESNVLACLSKVEVGEYSTYICDDTLTADALFSVLRNRGADAIYLRGAGSWVRYATDAAGTPLPGSGDNFTAVRYDTLFIGG